jgi:hypothetical protein
MFVSSMKVDYRTRADSMMSGVVVTIILVIPSKDGIQCDTARL